MDITFEEYDQIAMNAFVEACSQNPEAWSRIEAAMGNVEVMSTAYQIVIEGYKEETPPEVIGIEVAVYAGFIERQ